TAVYQLLLRLVPGPRLHQAVHPQIQVEAAHVAVQVTHLLLPSTPDLLDVLVRLFQGTAVGHRLQDLLRRRLRVGAEERHPAVLLLNQHHTDHAARRPPRSQEGLDRLSHRLTVLHALDLLPAPLVPGPLGQRDASLAVDRRTAGATLMRRDD